MAGMGTAGTATSPRPQGCQGVGLGRTGGACTGKVSPSPHLRNSGDESKPTALEGREKKKRPQFR